MAPYESSNKGRLNLSFGPVSIPNSTFPSETADITDQFSSIQLRSSISSADLPLSREKKDIKPISDAPLQWNPFEDSTPFDQMTEDHIFEAEFDALRDRPSGMYTSKQYSIIRNYNL